MAHARKERVLLLGTDHRITSGPAAKRPHSKAEYMTAPERFADRQIPLAPRAPSIHDPTATSTGILRCGAARLPVLVHDRIFVLGGWHEAPPVHLTTGQCGDRVSAWCATATTRSIATHRRAYGHV